MSVAAMFPIVGIAGALWPDRALSDEAQVLRELVDAATEFSGSITMGESDALSKKLLQLLTKQPRLIIGMAQALGELNQVPTCTRVNSYGCFPIVFLLPTLPSIPMAKFSSSGTMAGGKSLPSALGGMAHSRLPGYSAIPKSMASTISAKIYP